VPISLYIHGTNINDWGGRSRGQRLGRLGGNRWTAYNWETNASNAGADFQHQNDAFPGLELPASSVTTVVLER